MLLDTGSESFMVIVYGLPFIVKFGGNMVFEFSLVLGYVRWTCHVEDVIKEVWTVNARGSRPFKYQVLKHVLK